MSPLSPRQIEVIELLQFDLSDKEIGAKLNCSHHTVRAHLKVIFARLGVAGRTGAALSWASLTLANDLSEATKKKHPVKCR